MEFGLREGAGVGYKVGIISCNSSVTFSRGPVTTAAVTVQSDSVVNSLITQLLPAPRSMGELQFHGKDNLC